MIMIKIFLLNMRKLSKDTVYRMMDRNYGVCP